MTRTETRPNIFLLTVDATNDNYLGLRSSFNTTPALDALFSESAVLSNTLTVRGITAVAMPSFLSGYYPATHRANSENWGGTVPLVQERLKAAGYHTYGFSANMCTYIDTGMDEKLCPHPQEQGALSEVQRRDDPLLVDSLLAALDQREPDVPVFAWIHLLTPHEMYEKIQPWYDEFHPDAYRGTFDPGNQDVLDERMLARTPLTPEERAEMDAWYSSDIRQTDAVLDTLLSGLRERGLYDDSLIVFGADHGEELSRHDAEPYFHHGCSVYNDVMRVTWSVRGPGIRPMVSADWVSSTDISPTILELAGVKWEGTAPEGRSLAPLLFGQAWEPVPVYAERGKNTAMVIENNYKYVLNPDGEYRLCRPYQQGGSAYRSAEIGLFDLDADPGEGTNLAGSGMAVEADLHARVCGWVRSWPKGVAQDSLSESCN